MATLTAYTITTIDTEANTLTASFTFDDGSTATECISCGMVGRDEQVQVGTQEDGTPILEKRLVLEPRFDVQDPAALDQQIRAYATAYQDGLAAAAVQVSDAVDALVGVAQDAASPVGGG